MNAYDEGKHAFHNGPYDSPYDRNTPDWEMWCDGWDDAGDEQIVKDQAALDEAMAAEDKYRHEHPPGGRK